MVVVMQDVLCETSERTSDGEQFLGGLAVSLAVESNVIETEEAFYW
jgi:hypothetical protein